MILFFSLSLIPNYKIFVPVVLTIVSVCKSILFCKAVFSFCLISTMTLKFPLTCQCCCVWTGPERCFTAVPIEGACRLGALNHATSWWHPVACDTGHEFSKYLRQTHTLFSASRQTEALRRSKESCAGICGTQLEKQPVAERIRYEVDVSHEGLVLLEPDHQIKTAGEGPTESVEQAQCITAGLARDRCGFQWDQVGPCLCGGRRRQLARLAKKPFDDDLGDGALQRS